MSTDHRLSAQAHAKKLIELLTTLPPTDTRATLLAECESLVVAIGAFHMEGIRFRMFNVDRLLSRTDVGSESARAEFAATRRELEAAGFHTRSHQAPG